MGKKTDIPIIRDSPNEKERKEKENVSHKNNMVSFVLSTWTPTEFIKPKSLGIYLAFT